VQTRVSRHEAGPLCPVMLRMGDDGITKNEKKKEIKFKDNNEKAQNKTSKQIHNF